MENLSHLASSSIWPTSQSAGDRASSSEQAMTAKGSPPVGPELPPEDLSDPTVQMTPDPAVDRGLTTAQNPAGDRGMHPDTGNWGFTTVSRGGRA